MIGVGIGGGGVGDDVCDCNRTAGGVADAFDRDVIVGEARDGLELTSILLVTCVVVGIGVDASMVCLFGV